MLQSDVNNKLESDLRVDQAARKSWIDIAFIRAGGMFSAPSLMVGAALGLGLALPGAAFATLLGFGFIVVYMCFICMQASDLGVPTASLAAPSLGNAGSRYLVSLLVGVVTIGWFGVQTAVCGASLSFMLSNVFSITISSWICSIVLGVLMLGTALFGFEGLKWLSSIAAPLLVIVCLYGVIASLENSTVSQDLLSYAPLSTNTLSFVAGVNMAVGLFAFAGPTAGDVARFARSRKDAVLSCIVGVIPAALIALSTGAALAILLGESDVAVIMNSLGVPAVGLIALVLSAWAVNAANAYSAGLGFAVMLGSSEEGSKWTTAVSGVLGIALAVAGILDQFEVFLAVLSACGPALAATMIADYWIVRKGRPENIRVEQGFSIPGIAGFTAGIFVAFVTGGVFELLPGFAFLNIPFFVAPINGMIASIAVYVLIYFCLGKERFAGSIALCQRH